MRRACANTRLGAQDTWTLRSRWSGACGCWTEQWRCSTASPGSKRRQRLSGVRSLAPLAAAFLQARPLAVHMHAHACEHSPSQTHPRTKHRHQSCVPTPRPSRAHTHHGGSPPARVAGGSGELTCRFCRLWVGLFCLMHRSLSGVDVQGQSAWTQARAKCRVRV